jgi:hypothetical protein
VPGMKYETIKARFVGGPWHNEIKLVPRMATLKIREPESVSTASILNYLKLNKETFETTDYLLFHFVTEGGAEWYQYVHQSLVHNGTEAEPWTYCDDVEFPILPGKVYDRFLNWLVKVKIRWELRRKQQPVR